MAELGVRLLRPLTAGQGPGGAHGRHVPGPPRDRTAPRLGLHHRRGAGRARALPAALQRPLRRRGPPARPAWRPLGSTLDLGAVLAFRHTRTVARDNTVKPLAHAAAAALTAAAQLRRRARGAGAPRRRTRGPSPGRDHPCAARPAPRRRAARAPLRAGARPCAGAHRLRPRPQWRSTPAGAPGYDGTIVNAAAPTVLRSPTASQAARWKAIQQALLHGLSMRATARLLGMQHHQEVRPRGGPSGRQGAIIVEQRRRHR